MTGLLVSVRSAAEAEIALAAGVHVIDVKEPSHGSLGAASTSVMQEVVELVGDRTTVSAACGELREQVALPLQSPKLPATGLTLAKIALAGCARREDWQARWRDWAAALPAPTKPVGVVYADRAIADSPPWQSVLELSASAGAPYLLIDTFDKSAGTLFDHFSPTELAACAREVRAAGLGLVLAGSLAGDAILRAREFSPDYIAVRGAACRSGRAGALDADAIRELLETLERPKGIPSLSPAN